MLCSQYNPQDNITLSSILFPNIILRRGFYISFWDNMKVALILYSNMYIEYGIRGGEPTISSPRWHYNPVPVA